MTLDDEVVEEILATAEDAAQSDFLRHSLTLFAILEGVKFPKGTRLKGTGDGALEVNTPGVPAYEIRLKAVS